MNHRDGLSATDIVNAVGGTPNTMSAHLAILNRAGLITARKDGRKIFYKASMETVQDISRFLLERCEA